MAITVRADVIGTVPTVVAREVLKYTTPNLELWKRIRTDLKADLRVGQQVQMPLYNDTSATPPAATQLHTGTATGFSGTVEATTSGGAQLTYGAQTIGSVTVYIANWYYFAAELSAYAEAVAQGDLTPMFKQAGLDSLARQIDSSVSDLIGSILNTEGSLAAPLSDALVREGVKDLDTENIRDARHFVFSAEEKANFFSFDKYVNSLYRNEKPLTRGDLGNLYGMDWAWTTQVPVASGGHRNVMFASETWGGQMRRDIQAKVAEGPDPLYTERIVGMAIWGVNEMRDRFARQMLGV